MTLFSHGVEDMELVHDRSNMAIHGKHMKTRTETNWTTYIDKIVTLYVYAANLMTTRTS